MTTDTRILIALRRAGAGFVSGADLSQQLGVTRAAIWARIEELRKLGYDIAAMWRIMHAPFGFSLRAGRDGASRADAIGIDVKRVQWLAFPVAGAAAGLAGALYAFSKGSLAPDVMAISRSVDGLVMVLLGGVQTLTGPIVGAVVFTWLQDEILRRTEFWRLILGLTILALVLLFPRGIVGSLGRLVRSRPT